ncbi:MAG TPA: 3-hydroxyacyl-ACP dehydratase FabZ [Caldisericia bacterium]|nr:3-hydroxyacyl-ACP dehydratase FabZ [Caldisericia bacterium]HQL66887.1 3-hydroxyacyl-ACP dehydratase FabZ [Caldisericia bacterium]HQO99543.1 3-hydroxyacyl-ACP dehydratase FabZ [Caldisericia bacterium]
MEEIKKLLPHREPFIFVDEILERVEGKKIIASRKIRNDEFWVKAHFPDLSVMPGVLIVEALAQTSLLIFNKNEEDLFPIFVKIESFVFKKPVFPSNLLILKSEVLFKKMGFIKFKVSASVDDETVADGIIFATLKRKEELLK